jgi:nucleoside-triphosphatase THEP1
MIRDFKNSTLIFGGKYGITCEEIDEDSTVEFIHQINDEISLILVDELGKNIKNKIKRKYKYMDNFNNAIEKGIEMNSPIILLIYRSIFSDQNKR